MLSTFFVKTENPSAGYSGTEAPLNVNVPRVVLAQIFVVGVMMQAGIVSNVASVMK